MGRVLIRYYQGASSRYQGAPGRSIGTESMLDFVGRNRPGFWEHPETLFRVWPKGLAGCCSPITSAAVEDAEGAGAPQMSLFWCLEGIFNCSLLIRLC
jgi:hypothetical protein